MDTTVAPTDRVVVEWALGNGYPCVYRIIDSIDGAVLTVVLDHATAYFRQGRLVKVACRRDGRFVSDMADELASVFAVCAYIELYERAADELMHAHLDVDEDVFAHPAVGDEPC